jgi:predicted NACHT family NTPase
MSDFVSNIGTELAKDFAKEAIGAVAHYLSRWNVKIDSTEERLQHAIADHQREVKNWSEEISFKDLAKPKQTSEVFVPLDIYLLPQRQHLSREERLKSAPLASIMKTDEVTHLVVLGQPGAGKTTAIKHLCQEMLSGSEVYPMQQFPILIRLRDINGLKLVIGPGISEPL